MTSLVADQSTQRAHLPPCIYTTVLSVLRLLPLAGSNELHAFRYARADTVFYGRLWAHALPHDGAIDCTSLYRREL